VTNAYSASIGAGYELKHNLKVGLDIEYSKNPDFDKDVRAFAKVVYGFDLGGGSHGSQDKPKEVK
jgi:opacity protein-like surface antigen